MTKEIFAKGTAKIIPLLGGIVSGGITLFTLRPMSMRLVNALDEANFSYSREEFEADWRDVMEECETDNSAQYVLKEDDEHSQSSSTILNSMKEAKSLLDEGLITEEEYEEIKAKLIAKF